MGKSIVSARLRPNKDDDIRKALGKIPVYYDESDIVREALRQFLFSHKGRTPQLLGSQVYKEDENVKDINKDDEVVEENCALERVESTVDIDDLESNLDKFITE
jgi:Arc/MetJ-type ribon-helix-helix transcriptional regulator